MTRRRWEIWIWTCVFALLPFLLMLFLAGMRAGGAARELLSFALTLSIISLAELRSADDATRHRVGYESLHNFCALDLVIVAALYGNHANVHGGKVPGAKVPVVAIIVAIIALTIGTRVQRFFHRRRDDV